MILKQFKSFLWDVLFGIMAMPMLAYMLLVGSRLFIPESLMYAKGPSETFNWSEVFYNFVFLISVFGVGLFLYLSVYYFHDLKKRFLYVLSAWIFLGVFAFVLELLT